MRLRYSARRSSQIGGEAIGPSFFFACRELLREALDGLKEYRKVRKTNFERSATLSQGVVDSGSLFDLMKEMVEGHNVTFQHLLRKQPHSKSANLVEEIIEIWTVLSKSLSCIRKWDNAEGALALNCIDLLIELCQVRSCEDEARRGAKRRTVVIRPPY